jgi:hypothetical protein
MLPNHARITWSGWLVRVVIVGALLMTYLVVNASDRSAFGETGGTTSLVVVDPVRLVDTRIDLGVKRVNANTYRVQADGIRGIPNGAEAIAVSIAVTGAASSGYLVAYPAGGNRAPASNLNYEAGQTLSTGAVIPLNKNGAFDIYTLSPVDVVVDVTGAFVSSTTARAGRFVAVDPGRLLDTRTSAPIQAGHTTTVRLPSSVPADATAAIVTLTSTWPNSPGYFTAFAAGGRPGTATLNVSTTNSTRGTTAIVPLANRAMSVYSSHGGNLVIDLVGYFTGPSAAPSTKGLFVPTTPKRRLDTRESVHMRAGESRSFASAKGAVALGALTMVGGTGHAVAYANGTARPKTSSINLSGANLVTNLAVSRVSKAGISVFSATDADYIYDQFGYFVGDLAPVNKALDPTTPPERPTQRECSVSQQLVPSCGVWLGASIPSRDGSFDFNRGLAEYEGVAQNTPDILHFYKTGAQRFPSPTEIALSERPGRQRSLLLYNWKPSGSKTWRQIADGAADSEIATVASNLKKYPHQLFLNIFHEPEDNVRPAAGSGMTPQDYAAMYRHVVAELKARGVTNAVYVWNVMGFYGWRDYFDGLYPGNDVVDWICWDPYAKDNRQSNLSDIISREKANLAWSGFYDWAQAKAPGTPMMLCEWGVDIKSNADPASVLRGDAATQLAQYPMLKALVYWNSIDKVNARIDDKSAKGIALGQAYREFAAQPVFNMASPDDAP